MTASAAISPPAARPGAASPQARADVCFLLEGTYPYVPGGVSAWVDQLIRGMPDLTFALYYLGSQKTLTGQAHYKLHPNIISLTEVYLYDRVDPAQMQPGRLPARKLRALYDGLLRFYNAPDESARLQHFWAALALLEAAGPLFTFGNLCHDYEAWEIQLEVYEKIAPEESFIDFFWTTRFLHLPVFRVLHGINQLPRARVYHAVTTGYAGLAGAIAARKFQAPYLVTEHGIYTNERLAEISRADWIYEAQRTLFSYSDGLSTFKRIWVEFFFFLARVAYETTDLILTLFQGNARMQIDYGADPAKVQILPNGIDPTRFDLLLQKRRERLATDSTSRVIGFIGRVVSIKDVKTLIRATRILVQAHPETVVKIIGPTNEEAGYFSECQTMVEEFGLQENILFLGNQNIQTLLHELDVMILTSVSEGLPLVILEAFAAGVPVVATDVGACRELINGRTEEDQALGPAGLVTHVSAPAETAAALDAILTARPLLVQMGAAGRQRAERYYTQKTLLDRYHHLYTDCSWSRQPGTAPAGKS